MAFYCICAQSPGSPADAFCGADTLLTCSEAVLETLNFELLGITPESIFYAFTWGFGTILAFWSIGFMVHAVKGVLKEF